MIPLEALTAAILLAMKCFRSSLVRTRFLQICYHLLRARLIVFARRRIEPTFSLLDPEPETYSLIPESFWEA